MTNRSYFKKGTISFRAIAIAIAICLVLGGIFAGTRRTNKQQANAYGLPSSTKMLPLSRWQSYPVLKGIRIDPEKPLNLEFIIDTADKDDVSKEEASRLIRYFLAGLTLPDEDLWVNLSPYEEERVVSDALALTDLGKDMLGQDYVLKQLLSSLTYPEDKLGKEYWKEVYQEVARIAGTTNIPINTFNKVWIMPDRAKVYEKGNVAFVARASLKCMLEEDYLAMKNSSKNLTIEENPENKEEISKVASKIMKQIVLPKIQEDVSYGKNFATLRQIYHSLILGVWFKQKFKDSFYKHYIDQGKIKGIDLEDKGAKEKIYDLYVEAYKKGVYDYVRRDYDSSSHEYINRRYYSGGVQMSMLAPDVKVEELPEYVSLDELVDGQGKWVRIKEEPITAREAKKAASPELAMASSAASPTQAQSRRSFLAKIALTAAGVAGGTLTPKELGSNDESSKVSSDKEKRIDVANVCRIIKSKNQTQIRNNAAAIVKVLLGALRGEIDLGPYFRLDGPVDTSQNMATTLLFSYVRGEELYKEIIEEIINQKGVPTVFRFVEKDIFARGVIEGLLKHGDMKTKAGIMQRLIDSILHSQSDAAFSIFVQVIDEESARLLTSNNQLPRIIALAGDRNYKHSHSVINLLGYLISYWPNSHQDLEQRAVDVIVKALYDERVAVRVKGLFALRRIMKQRQKYNVLLDNIDKKRKIVKVLPENRQSQEVVLIVIDDFSEEITHGVAVLSQMLSEISQRSIDLNNPQTIQELASELGVKNSRNKNARNLARLFLLKYKITLLTFERNIRLNELKNEISRYRDRTMVYSISLGGITVPFGDFLEIKMNEPQWLNGYLPLEVIKDLSGKETVFMVGAGNKGEPRIFTHARQDNVIVIGAAEKNTRGQWQKTGYSNYGPDISFLANGVAPDGQVGTSFAGPRYTGMLLRKLSENSSLSAKEANVGIEKEVESVGGSSEFFDAGYLGKGVLRGVSHGQASSSSSLLPQNPSNQDVLGGIDFNADQFNIETQGQGMRLPTNIPFNTNIEGLTFTIITIEDISEFELRQLAR